MNSNDITPKKGMSLIIICKAELQVFSCKYQNSKLYFKSNYVTKA